MDDDINQTSRDHLTVCLHSSSVIALKYLFSTYEDNLEMFLMELTYKMSHFSAIVTKICRFATKDRYRQRNKIPSGIM